MRPLGAERREEGTLACTRLTGSPLLRHGQLGHGTLEAELEPRLLEALQGLPMAQVAAGGWHSVVLSGE